MWGTGSWTNLGSLVGRVKSQSGWLWGCGSPRTGFHQVVGRAIAQGLWFWDPAGLRAGAGLLVAGTRFWVLCCMALCLGRLG